MTRPRKPSRKLTKRQIRARYASARREGRILQKKGLLSSRANLSKAKPSLAVRKKIDSLRGILTGTQQAVEITDVMAPRFKARGMRVIGNKVILDKQPEQKFVRRRSEIILRDTSRNTQTSGLSFETILIPIGIRSLQEFIDWIEDDPEKLQRMLPPGTAFAFTFHGHNSREIFPDALSLAEYLRNYLLAGQSSWQHFVLIRLIRPGDWVAGIGRRNRRLKSSQDRRQGIKSRSQEYKRYHQTHRKIKNEYSKAYYRRMRDRLK